MCGKQFIMFFTADKRQSYWSFRETNKRKQTKPPWYHNFLSDISTEIWNLSRWIKSVQNPGNAETIRKKDWNPEEIRKSEKSGKFFKIRNFSGKSGRSGNTGSISGIYVTTERKIVFSVLLVFRLKTAVTRRLIKEKLFLNE